MRDPALRMDRFVTWVFLGFGAITVFTSIGDYTNMEQYLSSVYQQFVAAQQGVSLGRYPDPELARVLGLAMMTADAAIFGFTVWWSVTRMNANRRAIFVPVVGWLIASAVSVGFLAYAFSQDPAFIAEIQAWMQRVAESATATPTVAPTN